MVENIWASLSLTFFLVLFLGRMVAYWDDIVMLRPPEWIRRILYIVPVRMPFVPLYSAIWQIGTYLLGVFVIVGYFTLSPEEFRTVVDVALWIAIIGLFTVVQYASLFTGIVGQRRVYRVIGSHFDRDIWLSSSRKIFDEKLRYAEKRMKHLVALRKVEIKKARNIFGKQAFKSTKKTPIPPDGPVPHWYQYDPLTQRQQYFIPSVYYFYAPKLPGLIAAIENEIRTKWQHDTGKKKKFWTHGRKIGIYGYYTEWR